MGRIVKVGVVVATMALVFGLRGQERALAAEPASARPAEQPVDLIMGDYEGTFFSLNGPAVKAEAKVIAEFTVNKDKTVKKIYRAVLSTLRPEGARTDQVELIGEKTDGEVPLVGKSKDAESKGLIANEKLAAEVKRENAGKFELKHVVRHSPAEGQKPPEGAIVLLPFSPGKPTSLDEWTNKNWKIVDDGSIQAQNKNNLTVREFGDCRLHVEFMCPYEPETRGQGRGNSGVYLQNRYEVQVLDSFGLPPKYNECGAIYEVAAPKVNACLPPLSWQTYDITFRTHRFDTEGKVVQPATMTVYHNGVLIHDKQPVMDATRAAGAKGAVKRGPLMLQHHGNPVRYRNVWLVELKDEGEQPKAEAK